MTNVKIRMTNEFQMTNDESSAVRAVVGLSFGLRHSFVILPK